MAIENEISSLPQVYKLWPIFISNSAAWLGVFLTSTCVFTLDIMIRQLIGNIDALINKKHFDGKRFLMYEGGGPEN